MTKIKPEVYVRAAELIVTGAERYSCDAISAIDDNYEMEALQIYAEHFIHIYSGNKRLYWWNCNATPENQLTRSLALLFMAEIVRDGV